MNSRLDLRDLLQLWTDDIESFEETGRIGRNLSDALSVLLRAVVRVVLALRPGSVVHVGESFKSSTPVCGVPKVQKIKKSVVDRFVQAESENKAKTESVQNEPIQSKNTKTDSVSNEPIQPPLPLGWAM